jgi:outer membrane protein OmpA-like peptidoglycan-associated protein
MDVGLRYQTPWKPLAIGMAVQNVGMRSAFIDEADPLPMLLLGGIAVTTSLVTDQEFKVLLDINQLLNNGESALLSAGVEYGMYNILFLRGGYRFEDELGQLSLGAGIQYQGLGVDYAFQPLSDLGDSHRFTLSYSFLPKKAEAKPKSFVPKKPKTQIRELKVLPRKFESVIMFKTPQMKAGVREWEFEVRDYSGNLVKKLKGMGKPPAYVKWDGRNQAGKIVARKQEYQFVFKSDDKEVAKQELPAFHPVVKLKASKKQAIVPVVQFKTKSAPDIKKWSLDIVDNKSRKVIRTIAQNKPLPENILWDGKNNKGKVVDTEATYSYVLNVEYPDCSTVSVSERIRPVVARPLRPKPGVMRFVIPGVLFDFNSAALKPEMMDKIMAAIQVLQLNQSTAKLVCEGHSDDVGGQKYNEKLSLQRAEMVSNFILKKVAMPEDRISEIGYGKKFPISKSKTEIGRAKNRRVEIKISLPEEIRKKK